MSKSILKPAFAKAMSAFQADGADTVVNPIPAGDDTAALIFQWLAKLKLLHNVPFRYLVPDERMLPPESIRFFYLDVNWVDALVDGAYSIGRYTTGLGDSTPLYNKVEGALSAALHEGANTAARNIRSNIFKAETSSNPASFETITGFLLRSQVVKGWPGLQVNAYSKDNYPADPNWDGTSLKMLRLEHLSDEVIIGIFEGETYQLDIHEPSEGLHFGFDTTAGSTADQLFKNLRSAQDGSAINIELKPDDFTQNQVFRPGTDQSQDNKGGQVVNLYNLSALMFKTLNELPDKNMRPGYTEKPVASTITDGVTSPVSGLPDTMYQLASSDFALQMVEGVGMVSFFNKNN